MATRHHQRGASLLEALIAFLALSLGMLAITRLQGELRVHSDLARHRSEAVRLGQQDIERLRAFSSAAAAPGAIAFDDIASATALAGSAQGYATNAQYRIVRTVRDDSAGYKAASIDIVWTDRRASEQRVQLTSLISRSDPFYSGVLAVPSPAAPPLAPFGRHAAIPLDARDLGDGRSVLKQPGKGLVFVFDNASGRATSRCSVADTGTETRYLAASDLQNCSEYRALTVRGHVRFSLGVPPDADHAADLPLPLAISLAPAGDHDAAADCITEARKTVRYTRDGATRHEAVPLDASPGAYGVSVWQETDERFAAYTCFVAAGVPASGWSGRTEITAEGWTIGEAAADYRVCRHSVDYDGSGAIDGNDEHPADYVDVDVPLLHQNFLVIRGDQRCPAGRLATTDEHVPPTPEHHTQPHQP